MRLFQKYAAATLLAVAAFPAFALAASIEIEKPWARATPGGAITGAVYMTIENKAQVEDRLTGAASDAAGKLQIHEMKVVDGVMQMRELPGGLPIPANGEVALKPGGYHVMLIDLRKPLKSGETVALTLFFEKAGKVEVAAPVRDAGDEHSHMDHKDMH